MDQIQGLKYRNTHGGEIERGVIISSSARAKTKRRRREHQYFRNDKKSFKMTHKMLCGLASELLLH